MKGIQIFQFNVNELQKYFLLILDCYFYANAWIIEFGAFDGILVDLSTKASLEKDKSGHDHCKFFLGYSEGLIKKTCTFLGTPKHFACIKRTAMLLHVLFRKACENHACRLLSPHKSQLITHNLKPGGFEGANFY